MSCRPGRPRFSSSRPPNRGRSASARKPALLRTLLHTHPEAWDDVFPLDPRAAAFLEKLLRREHGPLLDVGCATGTLCAHLAARGFDVDGIDLTASFIAAAPNKAPAAHFSVGDMQRFVARRRYAVVSCLGTTFLYNTTNEALLAALACFRRALRRLFPQELRHPLEQSGFSKPELLGGFDAKNRRLDGSRLVAISRADK